MRGIVVLLSIVSALLGVTSVAHAGPPTPAFCAELVDRRTVAPPLSVLHKRYDNLSFTFYSADTGPEFYYLGADGRFVAWKQNRQALFRGTWTLRETFRTTPSVCPARTKVRLCFMRDGRPMQIIGGPVENPFAVRPEDAGCILFFDDDFSIIMVMRARGDVLGLTRMTAPPIALPHTRLSFDEVRRLMRR
jgi:hypothetical protein